MSGTSSGYYVNTGVTHYGVTASNISCNGSMPVTDVLSKLVTDSAMHSMQITKIEERLGIVHMNTDLENRWSKLRILGEEYRRAEAELMEKEKIMEILKK